jgi:hypothetical protein
MALVHMHKRTHTYSVPNVVSCGHTAHVGTCPACQRVQQQRQAAHLAAARVARARWQAANRGHATSHAHPGRVCLQEPASSGALARGT